MRAALITLALVAQLAFAGPPENRPPDNRPPGSGGAASAQASSSSTSSATSGDSSAVSTATGGTANVAVENHVSLLGEGGAASLSSADGQAGVLSPQSNVSIEGDTFNSESNNINTVLVPNNNTAGCMRVYGFSFGNGDGAGALGVPFRDKACDYELAADDAAAAGEHDIAWFWRCHKKHLFQPYRERGESEEEAIAQCYQAMVKMLGFEDTGARLQNVEHEVTLLAELSDEEAEELKEKIAELEAELEAREALIEQQQQQQQQIQQQQQQQQQQSIELLEQLRRDAERRKKALAALEKKEA